MSIVIVSWSLFLIDFFSRPNFKNDFSLNWKKVASLTLDQSNCVAWKWKRKDFSWTKPFPKQVWRQKFKKLFENSSSGWNVQNRMIRFKLNVNFIFRIWAVQLHCYFPKWNYFDCRFKWNIEYVLYFARVWMRLEFEHK